jgi:hypothetical protein
VGPQLTDGTQLIDQSAGVETIVFTGTTVTVLPVHSRQRFSSGVTGWQFAQQGIQSLTKGGKVIKGGKV